MTAPALPDAWTSSVEFGGRFLVIVAPAVGSVTIDWQGRCVRSGQVWAGPSIEVKAYTGHGWRGRLVADAVAWLQKVSEKREARRSWQAAVALQHLLVAEVDSATTLVSDLVDRINAATSELQGAYDHLRTLGYPVSQEEWRAVYSLHRKALIRCARRASLEEAIQTVIETRQDAEQLYRALRSACVFEGAP